MSQTPIASLRPVTQSLLTDREGFESILISDYVIQNGIPLLLAATKSLSTSQQSPRKVIFCCLENPPSSFREVFPSAPIFIDGFTNPFGWETRLQDQKIEDHGQNIRYCQDFSNPGEFSRLLESLVLTAEGPVLLLVDSLGVLLNRFQPQQVFALLRKLRSLKADVRSMFIFHRDLHDEMTQNCIYRECPVVLELQHTQAKKDTELTRPYLSFNLSPHSAFNCLTLVKRKSGKVVREKVVISIDSFLGFSIKFFTLEEKQGQGISSQGSAADPTSNLSFNLSLTEDQKKARADVQLPYLKAQEPEQKAVITYQPDEADDFDEEDPDDDLDI